MGLECNGVFKGGGAKGIAYAGALQACKEMEIDFKAVAGSSAGAITATLVACDYSPCKITLIVPEALKKLESVPRALTRVRGRPSLLSNEGLHELLETKIAEKIPRSDKADHSPRTFKEIRDTTCISLYVVTLDLATRQPLVFSPDLTPNSSVAAAVVASSAIPVAFPASRMVVDDEVHRVVDGGTWSNYPSFVFLDRDFQDYHGLDKTDRTTIGFILDDKDANPGRPEQSPQPKGGIGLISDEGSSTNEFGAAGAIMSSSLFRWTVGAAPVLFTLLSLRWLQQEITGPEPLINKAPAPTQDLLVLLSVIALAITGLAATVTAFVVLRLGRTLFDTGLVGASAAMGVGPGVAYWVGGGNDGQAKPEHLAVRIKVPDDLTTLGFDPDDALIAAAIQQGLDSTWDALGHRLEVPPRKIGDVDRSPTKPTAETTPRPDDEGQGRGRDWQNIGLQVAAYLYVLAAGTIAPFRVLAGFAAGSILSTALWVGVVGTVVLVGVWIAATTRTKEATAARPYPILDRLRRPSLLRLIAISVGVLAVFSVIPMLFVLEETSGFRAARLPTLTGTVTEMGPGPGCVTTPSGDTVCFLRGSVRSFWGTPGHQNVKIKVSPPPKEDPGYETYIQLREQPALRDLATDPVDLSLEEDELVFLFDTSFSKLSKNGEAKIRVDLDRNPPEAYVEGELISELDFALVSIVYLSLLTLAFRSRRAAIWLGQKQADLERQP